VAIAHGELRSSLTGPSWIVWPTLLSASFGVLLIGYLKAPYGIVGGRFAAILGRVSFSMYVWQYVVFEAIGRFWLSAVRSTPTRWTCWSHLSPYYPSRSRATTLLSAHFSNCACDT